MLNILLAEFKAIHNQAPVVGAELEFYLTGDINIATFKEKLNLNLKSEKGYGQYEIDLPPTSELTDYCDKITLTRDAIKQLAKDLSGSAIFEAKPFKDDFGSSMHFHISFEGLIKDIDNNLEKYARSLCYYVIEIYPLFMLNISDYARTDKRFLAPTHVSYGGNNRTVAIRIPDSLPKRLEHRLASANVDPYLILCSILKSLILKPSVESTTVFNKSTLR